METVLRRVLSSSDIGRDLNKATTQLYRSPQRDAMTDDQSMMARSLTGTNEDIKYESNISDRILPEIPKETIDRIQDIGNDLTDSLAKLNVKVNKSAVTIPPFKGNSDGESIDEWFVKYELMAKANNWSKAVMKTHLPFNMMDDYQKMCIKLLEDKPEIKYDELKKEMIKNIRSNYNPGLLMQQMQNRRLQKNETVLNFVNDKVRLLQRIDPTFTFSQMVYNIISGLDVTLFGKVLEEVNEFQEKHQKNIDNYSDLVDIIQKIRDTEQAKQFHKESFTKTVRFEGNPKRNENFRNDNRENLNRGRTYFPRENYSRNPNSYNQTEYSRENRRPYPRYNSANDGMNGRNQSQFRDNSTYNRNSMNTRPQNDSNIQTNEERNNENRQNFPKYTRTPEGLPICFICGEPGHTQYTCPKKTTEVKSKN